MVGCRGFLDQLLGGVLGCGRGRKNDAKLNYRRTLYWRVIAGKERKRLLLYAEMKLPGEAWLEYHRRR
jgi:hypothetical protein